MKNKAKHIIELFMLAWIAMDIQKMYDLCQETWKSEHSKNRLKKMLYPQIGKRKRLRIKSYRILKIQKVSEFMYDVDLKVKTGGIEKKLTARLICETAPYKASIEGKFGVNPISIIKNLY